MPAAGWHWHQLVWHRYTGFLHSTLLHPHTDCCSDNPLLLRPNLQNQMETLWHVFQFLQNLSICFVFVSIMFLCVDFCFTLCVSFIGTVCSLFLLSSLCLVNQRLCCSYSLTFVKSILSVLWLGSTAFKTSVREKLTVYFEREAAVVDDRTGFGVCAGFRVSGRACVASQSTCCREHSSSRHRSKWSSSW